ncbi:MAG: hypothetical protein MRK01_16250 [Candidatus Scalindua sp.]|nr:hypothetical protein [Candidatus Scalindua sp.]
MGGGKKMFLFMGYSSLFPFILISVIAHIVTYASCKRQTLNHLVSLRETKKREVEDYFTSIRKQVRTISEDRVIIEAARYFTGNYPVTRSVALSPLAEKQYRLEKRNKFTAGLTLNTHEEKQYHHFITEYCKRFENFEMYIAEPYSGKIVFSNSQGSDLSISLQVEPYTKTNFGRAFQLADKSRNPGCVRVTDFELIPPSYKKAASFAASTIYDGSEKVGILLYKVPLDEINLLMTNNHESKSDDMGKSGNVYIVGKDPALSISQSFSERKDDIFSPLQRAGIKQGVWDTMNEESCTKLLKRKENRSVRTAITGGMNGGTLPGYRNVPVMSTYTPLNIEDLDWGIVSEIDKTEVFSSVYLIRNYSLLIGGVYFLILTTVLIRSISSNKRLLRKRDENAGHNSEKSIFSPHQIQSRNFDIADSKADNASSTAQNSANAEKTSDFLQRCALCSEREDILANECMVVMNEIKNTLAKQSEQIYHICDTTQHAIYSQEDRYNTKKAGQGGETKGLMDRCCTN